MRSRGDFICLSYKSDLMMVFGGPRVVHSRAEGGGVNTAGQADFIGNGCHAVGRLIPMNDIELSQPAVMCEPFVNVLWVFGCVLHRVYIVVILSFSGSWAPAEPNDLANVEPWNEQCEMIAFDIICQMAIRLVDS